jgi:hypothetical protein
MRKVMSITLVLVLALSASAFARPVDETSDLEHFQYLDMSGKGTDVLRTGNLSVFGTAADETTYYGGTYWAADSTRWEALEDSTWTFDTGVGSDVAGSSSNPYLVPSKDPSYHGTMEGWTGFDVSFSLITYFRRVTASDSRWLANPVCVGSAAGLGGSASLWCGAFEAEANDLCYAAGQGYGNAWLVCLGHVFDYVGGAVTMDYDYVNESEVGFDYGRVVVDTVGNGDTADDVTAISYTDAVSGHETLTLTSGVEVPAAAKDSIIVKFCFQSDGAWSDEDGSNPTTCGGFAVDNVALSGGIVYALQGFETDAGGWVLQDAQPGLGGDWSDLQHILDLPPTLTPCECALSDTVMVFYDLLSEHPRFQDNMAASPWIDLGPDGYNNKGPGKFIQSSLYTELPLLNYIFMQFNVQFYPYVCLATGTPFIITSPWTSSGFVYYFGGVPQCVSPGQIPTRINFGSRIPLEAEQVRLGIGVISYCRFFANCTNDSNTTPWVDNVKLAVFGDPSAPLIALRTLDIPQDNFPTNGTLNISAPGRLDKNAVLGAASPEVGTALGDTLVCQGATVSGTGPGGTSPGAQVFVQFAVAPGPGVDPGDLTTFLGTVVFAETKDGEDWYSSRMDTAERANFKTPGSWMTAHIEGSTGFTGLDTDKDMVDIDPQGGMTRLKNDIFPDDLFTAGTRVNMFFKTRYTGGSSWYTTPDTTGGNYFEMEVLPSSMDPDGKFNCVLYVDHFDGRGAQPFIETALASVLGTGGENYEATNWDRYDVTAPSSQQGSFGGPANTEYGASIIQALGYKCIVWNSGNLDAFNLTKEDGDVLIPWLTLTEFDFNNLHFSGDGLVKSAINEGASEPSARRLVEDLAGVLFTCSTYRDEECPAGKAEDTTPCVNLDPVGGALVADIPGRVVDHLGQGNGCPQQRSFDVLSENPSPDFGIATGDEIYSTGTTTSGPDDFASIAIDAADAGPLNYRIVTDGISLHYRRDEGTACDFPAPGATTSITERVEEVMTFLGHAGALNVAAAGACFDTAGATGIGNDPGRPTFRTTLLNFAPNPLLTGATGHIRFVMAREGKAKLDIFDVNGRLVRTVFDGSLPAGPQEQAWNGTDESGRQVASGVYFYRLRANAEDFSKQMVVVRNGGN